MKAWNRKRKPKHTWKLKYKKFYFKYKNQNFYGIKKEFLDIEKDKQYIYNNKSHRLD